MSRLRKAILGDPGEMERAQERLSNLELDIAELLDILGYKRNDQGPVKWSRFIEKPRMKAPRPRTDLGDSYISADPNM